MQLRTTFPYVFAAVIAAVFAAVIVALGATGAWAQTSPAGVPLGQSQEPLAIQGDVVLTQAEIDAAFSRIPEKHRLAFIRSGERVDQLIRSLLQSKVLAAEARKAGYDETALVRERLVLAGDKELAGAWVDQVMAKAPDADYEALAYEYYLANPDQYRTLDRVDVTHLLISSENKSEEKALAQIEALRAELDADPARFDDMVMEYSEDPSKSSNKGRFPYMTRGEMVAPFEAAAFALDEPGQITQPVQTDYGYHLIRLNRKVPSGLRPYETVKEEAVAQAKERHLAQYRSTYMRKVLSEPIELPEGAVEAMVKRYFGENLELAPESRD
jgi:peptidyl-prolyl cis-trans isomerase C